jgi:hypothetical protein
MTPSLLLLLLSVLAFGTKSAVASAESVPFCNYTETGLYGGSTGGNAWNDAYVANGYPCGVVAPSFMNFTFGLVINTMVTVYNPSDLYPSHGEMTVSTYYPVNLHAYEAVTSLVVFSCTYNGTSQVCGITMVTNNSRPFQIGSTTGTSSTVPLQGGYLAYWKGTSGYYINQLGAGIGVFPS